MFFHKSRLSVRHLPFALIALLTSFLSVSAQDYKPLFSHLDLDRPELAEVKKAWEANQTEAALAALLQHFRQRKKPHWYKESPQAPKENKEAKDPKAEKILKREFSFVGKPATLAHNFDWNANPHRDHEWPIELNRHYNWLVLKTAYNQTGNPAYIQDFIFQLNSWAAEVARRKTNYTWRTLECGIRLSVSWPGCFFELLNSPYFTPEVMAQMLMLTWEQTDHLSRRHGGGNWLITETAGMSATAVLFPEFNDSDKWMETVFKRLSREIDNQVPPDGAQLELTPHYHGVTLNSFNAAIKIARFNGISVPKNVEEGIARMCRYLAYVSKPDGHFPMFNDSDHGNASHYIKYLKDDPAIQYILSHGNEGKHPGFTSVIFPWAGQYVMRSDWKEDGLYLAFDAGPYGGGHQHEDKLQIDVHAYGRSHILDPGRFTYAGPWRGYFQQTKSHSTVLIDGAGQNRRRSSRRSWFPRRPQQNRWFSNDVFDVAVGAYEELYGRSNNNIIHVRRIFFKRGEYWLIEDLIFGKNGYEKEHSANVQFQFGTTGVKNEAPEAGNVIFSNNDDANLAIFPLADGPYTVELHEGDKNSSSPSLGWIAWSLHKAWKEPATMAILKRKGKLPLRVHTLLAPYRGKKRPEMSLDYLPENGADASVLHVHGPSWDDYVYLAQTPQAKGRVGTQTTAAEIAWFRHDADGKLLKKQEAGTLQTGENDLRAEAEGRLLKIDCPEAGKITFNYGYAEGGGYLYSKEIPVKAGKQTIVLDEPRLGRAYSYQLDFTGESGKKAGAKGSLSVIPPKNLQFSFEGKDKFPLEWSDGKITKQGEGHVLRRESKATQNKTYLTLRTAVNTSVPSDFEIRFRCRTPVETLGSHPYVKFYLQDQEGRYWARYLSRGLIKDWRTVRLTRKDFGRDGGGKNNHPASVIPPGMKIKWIGWTVCKGRTDKPVAPVIEVDDLHWPFSPKE